MRRALPLLILLGLLLLAPSPATAQGNALDQRNICLATRVLAHMLCKDVDEVSLVGKAGPNIYVLSVFYANHESQFLAAINESAIYMRGQTWRRVTRVIPYTVVFDDQGRACAVVDFEVPGCADAPPIVCCQTRSTESLQEEDFWQRELPEHLIDDLHDLEQSLNATAPDEFSLPGQ